MSVWNGRRVFLTGHTGFKGSWLALWLTDLGAKVTGYALPPPTRPSLFEAAKVEDSVHHVEGDIRDERALRTALDAANPEIVFHLAAQPIVRLSYETPVETYATNVMGTVHLLEAVRGCTDARTTICITSDKCYDNREWVWPYRESDPMGGHDPYSSSKGCAELVIAAYRKSYFETAAPAERKGLASVRAGNVIGGGDWAKDRLVPDLIRALESGQRPLIRSPGSVRPWQHVLEALGGYILLAERMFAGEEAMSSAWNFGPGEDDTQTVGWIVDRLTSLWGGDDAFDRPGGEHPHEATLLKLDCSKARTELGWRPAMNLDIALRRVVEWHRAVGNGEDAREVSLRQICEYRRSLIERQPAAKVKA